MANLVDPTRQAKTRARARADGMFLHAIAADEIKDRLAMVNRRFTRPAVVTGFPDLWQKYFPEAKVVADTEVLALTPGAHDLVIHAMSLHWANDPLTQIFQCAQALVPDGMFQGVAFAGQTLAEFRTVLAEVETRLTGGLSPRLLPMGELHSYGEMVQMAGLALPVANSIVQNVTYPSTHRLIADLRQMGEGNALAMRAEKTPRALFDEVDALYHASYGKEGRIPATFEMVFLSGWAPDDSQQKPARRGSATMTLEDAFNAAKQTE